MASVPATGCYSREEESTVFTALMRNVFRYEDGGNNVPCRCSVSLVVPLEVIDYLYETVKALKDSLQGS